jgi:hypothetical protein
VSNDQVCAGFAPNPYEDQWDILRNEYGIDYKNRAYLEGTLLCFQSSVERYRKKYAPYVERGLEIAPLKMNPVEMGNFTYMALLSGGLGEVLKERPAWRTTLESIIADLGPKALPEKVLERMRKAKVPHKILCGLEEQMKLLRELCSEHEYVTDRLKKAGPVIVQLEDQMMGPNLILPVEAAVMNALSRPLRDGTDPFRWLIIDEFNQQMWCPVMIELLMEIGTMMRHRPISVFAAAQRATGLPPGLAGLVTLVAQFHTPSPWEFKRAQELFGVLAGMSYRQIAPLGLGQAVVGAVLSTVREYTEQAQWAQFRPSILWTAGETTRTA